MGKSISRAGRWYKINFQAHAFSITQLAAEFDERELQRALLNGHITRRIATLSDVAAYSQLPYKKRVAALNAARYASAFNAASPTPVVIALIAICASFAPKQPDEPWAVLLGLVGAGMLFVFDQAKSLGCARTWAEMFTDAEKGVYGISTGRQSLLPRARRAALRGRADPTSQVLPRSREKRRLLSIESRRGEEGRPR